MTRYLACWVLVKTTLTRREQSRWLLSPERLKRSTGTRSVRLTGAPPGGKRQLMDIWVVSSAGGWASVPTVRPKILLLKRFGLKTSLLRPADLDLSSAACLAPDPVRNLLILNCFRL
jgi:hypothetical protein